MGIGADTFGLNKTEFNSKLTRIIGNHRANSKIIGEAREFILRCCRLTERWSKMSYDSEVLVYLRNLEMAGGRKIKMISLEIGATKQPVPKAKLVDALYPPKKIATSATPEEKHCNNVKASMRFAVGYQLKAFRDSITLPAVCSLSGKKIIPGSKTDIDHVGQTFSEIADCFIREKGLKYTDITLKGPPTAKIFRDETLWNEWVFYHLQHARFALALSSANRSKGSDGYAMDRELLGSFEAESPEDLSLDF